MAENEDGAEKTHEPTEQKKRQAREQGRIVTSQDVFVFGAMAVGTAMMSVLPKFLPQLAAHWSGYLQLQPGGTLDDTMLTRLSQAWQDFLVAGLLAAVPVLLVILLMQGAIGGLHFAPEALGFKPEKLDPMAGLARIFSKQSLVNLGKSVAKVGVLGALAVAKVKGMLPDFGTLWTLDAGSTSTLLFSSMFDLLAWLTVGLAAIGVLDLIWQWYSLNSSLRMTFDEIKRESKEQNGSPEVKGRQRQKQQEASRRAGRQRKALDDVPNATAIVTNPTHFAVALRYVPGETEAPVILAMGRGPMAKEIMARGRKAGVNILQIPPLARALYYTGEIGMQITDQLFAAVAAILAHVYRLDRGEDVPMPDIDLPPDMRFDAYGRPQTRPGYRPQ